MAAATGATISMDRPEFVVWATQRLSKIKLSPLLSSESYVYLLQEGERGNKRSSAQYPLAYGHPYHQHPTKTRATGHYL